jgi:hypothetical protein
VVALWLAAVLAIYFSARAAGWVPDVAELDPPAVDPGWNGINALQAVILAPVLEEALFRGVIYAGLVASTSPRRAAFTSSGLWALGHDPFFATQILLVGLVLAGAYARSRSLVVPILAHATMNAFVTLRDAI